jgi:hypothetical protein
MVVWLDKGSDPDEALRRRERAAFTRVRPDPFAIFGSGQAARCATQGLAPDDKTPSASPRVLSVDSIPTWS